MALTAFQVKRRVTGAAGAPASLLSGEIAYNMVDGKLYIGYGDDGSGNATSIKIFAEHDYVAGGGGGPTYTEGNGIDITADVISVDAATIPALDAAKIGTGTFNVARIPDLDAAKITTGTIDVARLPVFPSSVQVISTGGIAALDAGQQASIGDGSVVTTTDGRRWVYTGTGSKTAEASYIELADITPDWSVIANKPTLGTMAAQDANAVAITGGTINGVILDGGTF